MLGCSGQRYFPNEHQAVKKEPFLHADACFLSVDLIRETTFSPGNSDSHGASLSGYTLTLIPLVEQESHIGVRVTNNVNSYQSYHTCYHITATVTVFFFPWHGTEAEIRVFADVSKH